MPRRYIRVCFACRRLFDTGRSDRRTCSSRCRVRAHRKYRTARIRPPDAYAGELAALQALCPGTPDADATWRQAVATAYLERLYPRARRPGELFAAFVTRYNSRPARRRSSVLHG